MVRIISALILAVTAACALAVEPPALVDNPPDRHIVVKGDTLWGISGKFLQQPWRWPELWQMNQAQIKDPHWIYPGDVVVLDRSGSQPRLKLAKNKGKAGAGQPGKTAPTIYATPVQQAIPSIPPNEIEAFISRPLIVNAEDHNPAVKIVATQDERMMLGSGDLFYASGIHNTDVVRWNVFRKGKALKDPDTGKVLAYEAFFLGNARLVKPGEPAQLAVTLATEEIGAGDRLLPAPEPTIISYVPHRPEQAVTGRILGIYGGVNEGGPSNVISISRGAADGLEIGHVLALFRTRVSYTIDESGRRVATRVPEERYGLAFVFRVFDRVAYALVVDAGKSVIVGDTATNP